VPLEVVGTIKSSELTSNAAGQDVAVTAADGSGNAGGSAHIAAGAGGANNLAGGNVTVAGGAGAFNGSGGAHTLSAGDGGGSGGSITFAAGTGGESGGTGGGITLGGGAPNFGHGGDVILDAGMQGPGNTWDPGRNGSVVFQINGSEKMRVDGYQNGGIFVQRVYGVTTPNAAVPVVIDSVTGQLGTMSSSGRFKKDIKPMNESSDVILSLKPVTFHYKNDQNDTAQFGLIAEDVAHVNPDLVVRDADGKIYTVRYDAVNAMLLNEFLKEHKKVEELEATVAELKSTVADQQKDLATRLKQMDAKIQTVSDNIEMSKPAPQTVQNNQ